MKKLLSLFLTAILCLSFVISSSAKEPIPGPVPTHTIDTVGASISFYRNSDFTDLYHFIDDINAGDRVYYRVYCHDGYFCKGIITDATEADTSSFIMPEGVLQFQTEINRYGDSNKDDKITLSDVSFLLKYLANYAEVCHKVRGMGEELLDFKTDGKVNLADCSEMLKWIAGYENAGPTAPEYEQDFSIEYIDNNVSIASYFVSDASLTVDNDGRKAISKYNRTVLTNTYDFTGFVGDVFGVNDVFYEIVRPGDYIPSLMNAFKLNETYNDEFFKEYDLVPLIVHTENIVYVDSICRSGDDIYSNIVIADNANSDGIHNECCFFFIAVPKNSTETHSIRIIVQDTFPDRFVTGFEF